MVRNRTVLAIIALLAATNPSRAGEFVDGDPVPNNPFFSGYLNWMASEAVAGRAAPLGIANRPCYYYEGSRLVVLPCPGAVVASEYAPPCGYHVCGHSGDWVSRRY